MTITKIKYYIILILIFFPWANWASAGVVINEFVSHPNQGEQEWIELLNTGDNPVDLTGWKFTELSSPNTTPKENDLISLSGTIDDVLVFEVGTSKLNDGGDSIGLYDGTNLIDRVTYGTESTIKNYSIDLSASPINKSSALISSDWLANQDSTKNSPNPNSDNDIEENTNSSETTPSTSTSSSNKEEEPEILKITTKIISPKIVTAGIPFSLSSLTTTNRGETYAVGKFVWNFGNGMVSEVVKSSPFDYVYEYPGEYALTLSYFDSYFSKGADATDRVIVKVISSEIFISSVGSDVDPFIELDNKSNYEIVLSNWVVTAGIHYFIIPSGTTLLPGKKIKLSPKITGFVGEDIKSVIITNPNKEITATYPIQIKKPLQKNGIVNNITYSNTVSTDNNLQDYSLLKDPQVINLNDLGASTGESGVNISNSAYPLIGLFVIIGLGITSFLLIKRKKNDNAYIEKEIRAEDMTIIE